VRLTVNGECRTLDDGARVADVVLAVMAQAAQPVAVRATQPVAVRATQPVAVRATQPVAVRATGAAQTRGVAVAVNGDVVPRSAWPDLPLRDGDTIEVLTAVPGG
jgi:sulfur carrier protein